MAEIQKKIKICPNGHPYDPSRFESCPICSNGGFAPTLDPFAPDSMSATVDPGQQNIGSFAQTAPPDSGYQVCCSWTGNGRYTEKLWIPGRLYAGKL